MKVQILPETVQTNFYFTQRFRSPLAANKNALSNIKVKLNKLWQCSCSLQFLKSTTYCTLYKRNSLTLVQHISPSVNLLTIEISSDGLFWTPMSSTNNRAIKVDFKQQTNENYKFSHSSIICLGCFLLVSLEFNYNHMLPQPYSEFLKIIQNISELN